MDENESPVLIDANCMMWADRQAGVVISAVEMCFEYFLIDQIFSRVSSVAGWRGYTRSVRTFLSSVSRVTVIGIPRYPQIETQDSGWLLAAALPPPRLICIPSLCQDTAEARAFTREQTTEKLSAVWGSDRKWELYFSFQISILHHPFLSPLLLTPDRPRRRHKSRDPSREYLLLW